MGVGQAGTTHTNELLDEAPGKHGSDTEYDDAGPTDSAVDSGHLRPAQEERTVSEYVAALQDGLKAAYRHARVGLQQPAMHCNYNGKVQRLEYQARDLVWLHDVTLGRDQGTKLQIPWYGPPLITKVLNRGLVVVHQK